MYENKIFITMQDLMEQMGCRITRDSRGITVTGSNLSAIEVDMADIPDVVPTMAVVAAFAVICLFLASLVCRFPLFALLGLYTGIEIVVAGVALDLV